MEENNLTNGTECRACHRKAVHEDTVSYTHKSCLACGDRQDPALEKDDWLPHEAPSMPA